MSAPVPRTLILNISPWPSLLSLHAVPGEGQGSMCGSVSEMAAQAQKHSTVSGCCRASPGPGSGPGGLEEAWGAGLPPLELLLSPRGTKQATGLRACTGYVPHGQSRVRPL